MTSVSVERLGGRFQRAFDLAEAATQDCTDDLRQANMWELPADDAPHPRCAGPTEASSPTQPNVEPQNRWGIRRSRRLEEGRQ